MHAHLVYFSLIMTPLALLVLYLYCDYHYWYYLLTISHIGDKHNRNHAMVTFFRKLDKFDPGSGKDWIQYVKPMEYYFLANEITSSNKKQALLISALEAKSYKLLRNLITPVMPSDKSFRNELKH